jgi:hypothetical protein
MTPEDSRLHEFYGHLLVEGNPATDAELLKKVAIRDGARSK